MSKLCYGHNQKSEKKSIKSVFSKKFHTMRRRKITHYIKKGINLSLYIHMQKRKLLLLTKVTKCCLKQVSFIQLYTKEY